jgi:hypothetical protein
MSPDPRKAGAHGRLTWAMKVALATAPLSLLFYVYEQWSFLHGRLDRGQVFGRDFINYWSGARLWLEGRSHAIFVQADYMRALARMWGAGIALHSFSYPPSVFPFIGWTGALSYGAAIALWCALGIAALMAAAWPASKRPLVALLILLSPAVAVCLDVGQNGLITGALLVGGLRLCDRKPVLAGALIGLATFKPQLGVLIPFALVAAGRWRVIVAAAGMAILLAMLSVLMLGVDAWRLYLSEAGPFQRFLLEHSTGMFQVMMPGPFMAGRLANLSIPASYALQAVAAAGCVALVVIHFRRLRLDGRQVAPLDILLLLAAGFVASPYGFNYDMPGVALALVLADRADPRLDESPAWRWAMVALWTAPILMMIVPMAMMGRGLAPLPLGPVLMLIGLTLTVIAARRLTPGRAVVR